MEYNAQPDRRLVALVLAVVVVFPVLIAAELAVPSLQPRFTPSGSSEAVAASGGTPPGATVVTVIMPNGINLDKSLNFQPATLVLVIGVNNSIVWHNDDTTDHTVTFISVPSGVKASTISAGDVPPGTSFGPITLTTPGTYIYHCQFHPAWMRGTIVVKS